MLEREQEREVADSSDIRIRAFRDDYLENIVQTKE